MPFDSSAISAYSLILAFYVIGIIYFYSYYVYNNNKIFEKTRYSGINMLIGFGIFTLFFSLFIFSIIDYVLKITQYAQTEINNIIFSLIIWIISLCHIIYNFLVVKITNKNKIDYTKFDKINFQKILSDFIKNHDIEKSILSIKKSDVSYFDEMIKKFDKNKQNILAEKNKSNAIAIVVCFNEEFVNRGSNIKNIMQIKLTLELAVVVQTKKF